MGLNKEAIEQIHKEMNYKGADLCCRNCQFFVPTDCSGKSDAEYMHCDRNAFPIPVEEGGYCDNFRKKLK